MKNENDNWLPNLVGKGYGTFWRTTKRYRVVKGSRASKKSTTTALNIICRMMDENFILANTLVVRKTYSSLKDSCFAQLRWAIHYLGYDEYWIVRQNPLELEIRGTGQKILFRGCDDPMKVTSITVSKGVLCWLWCEEAFELTEDEFEMIDMSLRGKMPPGYFVQTTLTFNPWSECWIKYRFFDKPSDNVFKDTTTYKCNEWLSHTDYEMFEDIKRYDAERYKVVGLGEWGITGGQFFDVWRESLHVVKPFSIPANWIRCRAMDWGTAHPYAVLWFAIDYDGNAWCYRELYGYGGKPNVGTKETAKQVAAKIVQIELDSKEQILYGVLDNACWANTGVTGPTVAEEINNELTKNGLVAFSKCSKGRAEGANQVRQRLIGEVINGQQTPALRFFNTCIHTIRTLPTLTHDKHNAEVPDTQGEDHCYDTVSYFALSRPYSPVKKIEKIKDAYRHDDENTFSAWAQ